MGKTAKIFERLRDIGRRHFRGTQYPFKHVAGAFRADGVLVVAFNGPCSVARNWRTHAEARLCRKLTPHSTVYVLRLGAEGAFRLSEPCASCKRLLARAGVRVVYFTDRDGAYVKYTPV